MSGRTYYQILIVVITILLLFLPQSCTTQSADILTERYEFDEKGRLSSYTTASGDQATLWYDRAGNLKEVDYPEGLVRYGYDEAGNRIWMRDPSGITEYYYDSLGRLVGVLAEHSPRYIVRYQYDVDNNVTSVQIVMVNDLEELSKYEQFFTDLTNRLQLSTEAHRQRQNTIEELFQRIEQESTADQRKILEYQVAYEYDQSQRLTRVADMGDVTKYEYDAGNNQIRRELPNGVRTVFSFDDEQALTLIDHTHPDRGLISKFRYEYDALGRVSSFTQIQPGSEETTEYQWNQFNRLSSMALPDGSEVSYQYDGFQRLREKVSPSGSITYSYDDYDRLVSVGDMKLEYNAQDQITKIHQNGSITEFEYDSRGNTLSVVSDNARHEFTWDGANNLVSSNTAGEEKSHAIPFHIRPIDRPLMSFDSQSNKISQSTWGKSMLCQLDEAGNKVYQLENGLNDFRTVIDRHGSMIGQHHFSSGFPHKAPELKRVDPNYYSELYRLQRSPKYHNPLNRMRAEAAGLIWHLGRYANAVGHATQFVPVLGGLMAHTGKRIRHEAVKSIRENIEGMGHVADYYERKNTTLDKVDDVVGSILSIYDWMSSGLNARDAYLKKNIDDAEFEIGSRMRQEIVGHGLKGLIDSYIDRGRIDSYAPKPLKRLPIPEPRIHLDSPENNIPEDDDVDVYPDLTKYAPPFDRRWPEPVMNDDGGGPPPGGGGAAIDPSDYKSGGDVFHNLERRFRDPIERHERELGGVELAATGQFRGSIGRLDAVVIDPETGYMVLVGERDYSLDAVSSQDLAVALYLAYAQNGQPAQFSLDPADPRNPDGDRYKAVYLPEDVLAGTAFGHCLFEADYLLKQWSMGVYVDDANRLQPRTTSVPNYRHVAQLAFALDKGGSEEAQRARYWLVSKEMLLKEHDGAVVFDKAEMGVNARIQQVDRSSPTGLSDAPTSPNSIPSIWAREFTDRYDDIAVEEPVFERLRELAKAVALANWMKAEGVTVDMGWVIEELKRTEGAEYVTSIGRLEYQWEGETKTYRQGNRIIEETTAQYVSGGVDFEVKQKTRNDDGAAREIAEEVKSRLQDSNLDPVFSVNSDGREYTGAVSPFYGRGSELWQGREPGYSDGSGTKYDINSQGKLTEKTNPDGTISTYQYASDGRVENISIAQPGGSSWNWRRRKDGSSWNRAGKNGRQTEHIYSEQGYLKEIRIDGETYAEFDFSAADGKAVARYSDRSETLSRDRNGKGFEFKVEDSRSGTVVYKYDSHSRLTSISGDNVGKTTLTYNKESGQLESVTQNGETTRYTYDSQGRVTRIDQPGTQKTIYDYGPGSEYSVTVERDGQTTVYKYRDNEISTVDAHGNTSRVEFNNEKQLTARSGPAGETRFEYNPEGDISNISFPDGRQLNYKIDYSNRSKDGASFPRRIEVSIRKTSTEQTKFEHELAGINLRMERGESITGIWERNVPKDSPVRSFDQTVEGETAILYKDRASGEESVAWFKNGRRVRDVIGEAARTEYAEIRSEKAKQESSERVNIATYMVGMTGTRYSMSDKTAEIANSELRTFVANPASANAPNVQAFFSSIGKGVKDIVIQRSPEDQIPLERKGQHQAGITAEPFTPERLVAALNARAKEWGIRVHLGNDIELAKSNLERIEPLQSPKDLGVYMPSEGDRLVTHNLDQLIEPLLENSSVKRINLEAGIIEAGNIIMISAHNTKELRTKVHEIGNLGSLQGKVVFMVTCTSPYNTQRAQEIIQKFGAIAVSHHNETIRPVAIREVLNHMIKLLERAEAKGADIHSADLIREAAEEALRSDISPKLKKEIRNLMESVFQLSENHLGSNRTNWYRGAA